MNVDKRGVIIGMALGDGYVQVRDRWGTGRPSCTLRVLHGSNQRAYCEWKAERLSWALGRKRINVTTVKNGPGGKYSASQFSVDDAYLGQVRGWLYPSGKKTYTRRVLDMLTPEGLAIWYMDDGHARRNTNAKGFVSSVSTNIATMCSEAEVMVVVDWFKDRFGIDFKTRCKKSGALGKQFYIECNTEESHKFASVIAPHVPEPMLYKLAHVATLTSHECQTPVAQCACGSPIYENRRGGLCTACYARKLYKERKEAGDEIVRPNGKPFEAVDKEPLR